MSCSASSPRRALSPWASSSSLLTPPTFREGSQMPSYSSSSSPASPPSPNWPTGLPACPALRSSVHSMHYCIFYSALCTGLVYTVLPILCRVYITSGPAPALIPICLVSSCWASRSFSLSSLRLSASSFLFSRANLDNTALCQSIIFYIWPIQRTRSQIQI